jgi:hypothetical protein
VSPGLHKEREEAALELCEAVQGLVTTNSVPDYMVAFLASRIMRVRRAFGLPLLSVVKEPEHTS